MHSDGGLCGILSPTYNMFLLTNFFQLLNTLNTLTLHKNIEQNNFMLQ